MKHVIVIDPGHGGPDPGTVYNGVTEAYANFRIALAVKYFLSLEGFIVYLTRYGNYRPSYFERTSLAKKKGADLFLSIHHDSPRGRRLVYYSALNKNMYSKLAAEVIAKNIGTNIVIPSTNSRFGRLYIDDVYPYAASILVEVDPISKFKDTKKHRIDRAKKIVSGVKEFFEVAENAS